MSHSLGEETHRLVEAMMKRLGYESADDLIYDALEFFEAAGADFDPDDLAAISESEDQIAAGQDLDWKDASKSLRKQFLRE